MTKKSPYGTISTIVDISKKNTDLAKVVKEDNVAHKVQILLKAKKIRLTTHANERMAERNVIYYELLQALSKCKHETDKDRFSSLHKTWQYSLIGCTLDERLLRIGVSFETNENTAEILLIVTVIDLT